MSQVPFAHPEWARYRKHRKCGPRFEKLWDRSVLAAQTGMSEEPSVYDPRLTDAEISEMEMKCVTGEGVELPSNSADIRRFYRRLDKIIGASSGRQTDYIMVQYSRDGSVHGYPVLAEYLRSRGAVIQ
jgi:hypothetical protein